MSFKADELISARNIIDVLIDVQINQVTDEPTNELFRHELESLYTVESMLSAADEYIFDDIETEQEYKNKIKENNYDR